MEYELVQPDKRQEIDDPGRDALKKSIYRVQRFLQGEEMHDFDNNVIPDANRQEQYAIALKNIHDLQHLIRGSVLAVSYRVEDIPSVPLYSVRDIVMRSDDDGHLAIIYGQNGVGHSFSLKGLGDNFDLNFV